MAKAQIGYNYSQYDLGASGMLSMPSGSFAKPLKRYGAQLHFTYNYSPYINYIAEVQVGSLAGGSNSDLPEESFSYANDYTAVSFRAQLQMGEILDYSRSRFINFFKNLYVSSGVGVIYTSAKDFDVTTDENLDDTDPSIPITYVEVNASNKSSSIFIPLKTGYELKLFNSYNEPWAKIDLGYQYNVVMSHTFDGLSLNSGNNNWSQFVVGVKFALGGITSYRKSIRY